MVKRLSPLCVKLPIIVTAFLTIVILYALSSNPSGLAQLTENAANTLDGTSENNTTVVIPEERGDIIISQEPTEREREIIIPPQTTEDIITMSEEPDWRRNPPFRSCNPDPTISESFTSATYTIEANANQTQVLNNISGQQDIKITLNNSLSNGGQMSGRLIDNNETQLLDFVVNEAITECINRFIPATPYPVSSLSVEQAVQMNPPFRQCPEFFTSATYTIEANANQTQVLNNISGQEDIKISLTNDLIRGGPISGKLIVDNNDLLRSVNLDVSEIETICSQSVT
jgi:hypothetical protein